jgi:hypothetical protein
MLGQDGELAHDLRQFKVFGRVAACISRQSQLEPSNPMSQTLS